MTDGQNRLINKHREWQGKIQVKEQQTVNPARTRNCNKQISHSNNRGTQTIKGVKDSMSEVHDGNNKWRTGNNEGGKKFNRWHDKIQPRNRWNRVKKNIKEWSIYERK